MPTDFQTCLLASKHAFAICLLTRDSVKVHLTFSPTMQRRENASRKSMVDVPEMLISLRTFLPARKHASKKLKRKIVKTIAVIRNVRKVVEQNAKKENANVTASPKILNVGRVARNLATTADVNAIATVTKDVSKTAGKENASANANPNLNVLKVAKKSAKKGSARVSATKD